MADSANNFHCIVPALKIADNKNTIWSIFSAKYFLDVPVVCISGKGDTLNGLSMLPLTRIDRNLFARIILNKHLSEIKYVPVCDQSMIKPCRIRN